MGRPRISDARSESARATHWLVAAARLIDRKTYREIEAEYGVSERSAREWCKSSPAYPGAPPALRRFARLTLD